MGKDRDGDSCDHNGVLEKGHKLDDLLAVLAEELGRALQFVSFVVGDMHLRVASMGPALVVITFAEKVDLELLDEVTLLLQWQDDEQTRSGELEQLIVLSLDNLKLLLDEIDSLVDFLVSLLDILLGVLGALLDVLLDALRTLMDMMLGVLGTLLKLLGKLIKSYVYLLGSLADKVLEFGNMFYLTCLAKAL